MLAERSIEEILAECERPLLFLAHQDDELGCAGLLQRMKDRIRVVFMTNGDGLAPSAGEDPAPYATLRKVEALNSLNTAGVGKKQTRFLGYSEIEIYRNMARLKKEPLRLSEVIEFFEPIRRSIAEAVYEFRPDVAFAVGYQGGHPEHDLVHFFGSLALHTFQTDVEADVPLYHFPEYELTILLPMRFRPWYPGEKSWIELSREELETKLKMAECYLSQQSLIKNFRRVVGTLTLPRRLFTREDPVERFFGREQLSLVPRDFDYRRFPYSLDFLNYVLEDFQGIPITFRDCIRPLVVAFEDNLGKQP